MDDDRVATLARAIAGFGLPGVPEPEPTSVPDQVWHRLSARVRTERITGLAVESEAAGWLTLTVEQASELQTAHRDAMAWCLSIERKLVGLAEAFDAEDIPFSVLKGASVAHTMYPDPSLRSFGDLDLLVPTTDYERACAVLGGLGHVRQRPEPRPGFEVRFGKASVHKHPDDGVEVDLHRTLVLGPFGLWIDPDELLARREPFLVAGRKLHRLDDTGMLVNVAMHAALGAWPSRLVPLRDVMQIAAEGDVEWNVLSRWARGWRLAAVLQHAFATASATLAAPVPAAARSLLVERAPKQGVRALKAYMGARRDQGGTAFATLRAIPGLRGKVSYSLALALPDRAFLTARVGSGRSAYLRRWRVPVRWSKERIAGIMHGLNRVR